MSKAKIITDYGNGFYKIKMIYGGRTEFNQRISILTQAISDLQDRIDAESDEYKKKLLKLEKAALSKSKSYLQDNFPNDYEINVYCCDHTEGLSGNVGAIDIPGEAFEVKIQPGFSGDADYDGDRDGIIWPSIAGSADWGYFNQAILPGWQKHKPTYRTGSIIPGSIDSQNHTCDVCIDGAFSSQQNLNVNQDAAIQGCPDTEPSGFADFCSRNPSHPACTNTSEPSPLSVGSTLLAKIKEINLDVNSSHEYQSDSSGWRVDEYWEIMGAGEKGDCIANYEEIYVENGIKKVGDLEVGDRVLSYDFKKQKYVYKPIKKIWEKGLLPGKRVGLKNGQSIDITENHPLWVRNNQIGGRSKYKISQYEKRYFKDIDLNRWYKRRLPIAIKIPYQVKDIKWLNKDLCFVAGHYVAEGWKDKNRNGVSSSGFDLIDKIIPLLKKNKIPFSEHKNSNDVPRINFLKSKFKEFLKTLKTNSFDIHLPEYLFHLPESKLKKILDGFYLGDGHNGNYSDSYNYTSNKQEVYSTISKQFASDIQRIGLQLGKTFHIWKQVEHQGLGDKPIYRITYNPNSFFLRDHGYKGISEVGIARKKNRDIGTVETRDFEIAGTNTFIFKNGLIAHNCEDFALTKMQALLDYGIAAKHLQIATCAVERGLGWHAVLMIQTQNQGVLMLDNRFDEVLTKETLQNLGYQWDTYQAAGRSWNSFSTKLLDIPIEYMTCHSAAFTDSDEVVVKFANQSWDDPKVIGFRSNPADCSARFYWVLGRVWPPYIQYNWNVLDLQTKAETHKHKTWAQASITWGAGWISGEYIFQAGASIALWETYYGTEPYWNSVYEKTTQKMHSAGSYQTTLADHPEPERSAHSGFQINGDGYIAGGTSCCHQLNQATKQYYDWDIYYDIPLPSVIPYGPPDTSSAENHFDKYNSDADSWASKQNIGTDRMLAQAAAVGGYGFIWGGLAQIRAVQETIPGLGTFDWLVHEGFSSSTKKYFPDQDVWTERKACDARIRSAAGNSENYLISYGGWSESSGEWGDEYPYSETGGEYYNDTTNSWSTLPDPGNLHGGSDAGRTENAYSHGRYPAGGWLGSFYILNEDYVGINRYDLDADSWSHFFGGIIDDGAEEGQNFPEFSIGGIIV
jgi:predicted transglutaminase-like cysteine proteinase